MTLVTGKHGTITYDVVTQDEETKQLLDKIVSSTLQSLVNEDKNRLMQQLSIPVPPKKKQTWYNRAYDSAGDVCKGESG